MMLGPPCILRRCTLPRSSPCASPPPTRSLSLFFTGKHRTPPHAERAERCLRACEAVLVLGPAGSRPALYASLCLRFWWNSDELRPLNGTQVTTNWAGERPTRHHIPLSSADMHSRFLSFLSSAVELPASCAGAVLCGRLPHTAPLVLPARPRADRTTVLLSRHQHTLCLVGEFGSPATLLLLLE